MTGSRPGAELIRITAPMRELLGAERTLLNFLTHLSGIATATRAWADALSGTGCTVRDTRKTTPGLRQLEKYAVRCGGGRNHRMGLGDAALIKDNHIAAAGGIAAAIAAVRAAAPALPLEVECDTLDQVREALESGAGLILLDNMDLTGLRAAAAMARRYPETQLEASGGLRLEAARAVARNRRQLRRRRRPHPLQPRTRHRPRHPGLTALPRPSAAQRHGLSEAGYPRSAAGRPAGPGRQASRMARTGARPGWLGTIRTTAISAPATCCRTASAAPAAGPK